MPIETSQKSERGKLNSPGRNPVFRHKKLTFQLAHSTINKEQREVKERNYCKSNVWLGTSRTMMRVNRQFTYQILLFLKHVIVYLAVEKIKIATKTNFTRGVRFV